MAIYWSNMFVLALFISLFSFTFTEPAMKIEVLKEAPKDCTRKAASGDTISMHYRGTLENGKEFDSSYSRNSPFEFKLGAGMVIAGWEQGVPGMCVGEKRKLTIPSSLAYGDRGFGDIIPAKSTLIFEIELINIKGGKEKDELKYEDTEESEEGLDEDHTGHDHEHPDTFEALDLDGNKEISMEEMTKYIKKYHEENDEQVADAADSIETIVGEIFQEDDKNKDGVISYEEYQHSAGMAEGDEEMEQGDYHGDYEEDEKDQDGKDEL